MQIFEVCLRARGAVRGARRCDTVDGGGGRTKSGRGRGRGGVLTARGGKETVKAGASGSGLDQTDRREADEEKETAKGDAEKTRNGPCAKQRQVAVSRLRPTVGWRSEKAVEVVAR